MAVCHRSQHYIYIFAIETTISTFLRANLVYPEMRILNYRCNGMPNILVKSTGTIRKPIWGHEVS